MMTLTQLKAEKEFIGNMTEAEYIIASRKGREIALNRKVKKEIYANIDKLIAHLEPTVAPKGAKITQAGINAYNAITKERDEVMLVTA